MTIEIDSDYLKSGKIRFSDFNPIFENSGFSGFFGDNFPHFLQIFKKPVWYVVQLSYIFQNLQTEL